MRLPPLASHRCVGWKLALQLHFPLSFNRRRIQENRASPQLRPLWRHRSLSWRLRARCPYRHGSRSVEKATNPTDQGQRLKSERPYLQGGTGTRGGIGISNQY